MVDALLRTCRVVGGQHDLQQVEQPASVRSAARAAQVLDALVHDDARVVRVVQVLRKVRQVEPALGPLGPLGVGRVVRPLRVTSSSSRTSKAVDRRESSRVQSRASPPWSGAGRQALCKTAEPW